MVKNLASPWCFIRKARRLASNLVDLADFDDALPFGDLVLDVLGEVRRGIAVRDDAETQEFLLDVRQPDDLGDILLQQIDHRRRRSGRDEYADHGFGFLAL